MSYPFHSDANYPTVDYTTDEKGTHLVRFWDESRRETDGIRGYIVIEADVLIAIAFDMCRDHIKTEWAKRHLEQNGYRVEKRTAASYGRLAGWAEFLGMGQKN